MTTTNDTMLDLFTDWLSDCPLPLSNRAVVTLVSTVTYDRLRPETEEELNCAEAFTDVVLARASLKRNGR